MEINDVHMKRPRITFIVNNSSHHHFAVFIGSAESSVPIMQRGGLLWCEAWQRDILGWRMNTTPLFECHFMHFKLFLVP